MKSRKMGKNIQMNDQILVFISTIPDWSRWPPMAEARGMVPWPGLEKKVELDLNSFGENLLHESAAAALNSQEMMAF